MLGARLSDKLAHTILGTRLLGKNNHFVWIESWAFTDSLMFLPYTLNQLSPSHNMFKTSQCLSLVGPESVLSLSLSPGDSWVVDG